MTGDAPHPAAPPVACPFCYMGPGEPCVTTSDNPCRFPHRIRVLAAYRAGVMDSCGDCGGTGVVRTRIHGRQDRLVPTSESCPNCGGYVEPGATPNPEREEHEMPTRQIEAESWLESMPAIPWEGTRCIPVVGVAEKGDIQGAKGMANKGARTVAVLTSRHGWTVRGWGSLDAFYLWRIDLDDPQGFGYAVRQLVQMVPHEDAWAAYEDRVLELARCWVIDWKDITEADKLFVAKALREVV